MSPLFGKNNVIPDQPEPQEPRIGQGTEKPFNCYTLKKPPVQNRKGVSYKELICSIEIYINILFVVVFSDALVAGRYLQTASLAYCWHLHYSSGCLHGDPGPRCELSSSTGPLSGKADSSNCLS